MTDPFPTFAAAVAPREDLPRPTMTTEIESRTAHGDAAVSEEAGSARHLEALRPHRWRRGTSGNPGGRVSALALRVRAATANGEELVSYLLQVLRNEKEATRYRLHAAEMLLARGWGRAAQPIALKALLEYRRDDGGWQGLPLAKLAPGELAVMEQMLTKLLAPTGDTGPADVREL